MLSGFPASTGSVRIGTWVSDGLGPGCRGNAKSWRSRGLKIVQMLDAIEFSYPLVWETYGRRGQRPSPNRFVAASKHGRSPDDAQVT